MAEPSEDRLIAALRRTFEVMDTIGWKLSKAMVGATIPFVGKFIVEEVTKDRRLSRLDDARMAMEDGMAALDELKAEAESQQQRHERTLLQLHRTLVSQETAQQKLDAIQEAMKADVDAFRTLHGVGDPRKERVIGFWTGVAASVVATIVWAVGSWAWGEWGFALWQRVFP